MRISAARCSLFSARCRLGERGQFVPLTSMVAFSAVLLMIAGMNIYHIAKAKLQTQNLADAAALAVAAMQAKAVNTIVDRNEWLNHMYAQGYRRNSHSVPNISEANEHTAMNLATAKAYANLVATINKAQRMFITAYDNFLGAPGPGGMASNGSGSAALADILSEIDGLQDPLIVSVWVGDDKTRLPTPQDVSSIGNLSVGLSGKMRPTMMPLKFRTANVVVHVTDDGDPKNRTLTQLLGQKDNGPDDPNRVGWMYPVWGENTLDVQVSKNAGTEPHWGVSVTIVKLVPLKFYPLKFFVPVQVTATSQAYVVNAAGLDSVPSGDRDNPKPPPLNNQGQGFRPTYFARLAYHQ